MSSTKAEDLWRGTSEAPAVIRARAATTPGERLAWLEEAQALALASGAIARDRARRQREANSWERQEGLEGAAHVLGDVSAAAARP